MSLALLSIPSNGANNWEDWVTREQQTEKDFKFISLTNWGSTSIPQVEAGSEIIVNGALYRATANETISGLSAVAVSTQTWFKVVPAGATATISAVTADASSWDADKGGYYDSNDLYIGGCYKDSGGNYINKWIYRGRNLIEIEDFFNVSDDRITLGNSGTEIELTGSAVVVDGLRLKVINIGDWDMDANKFKTVAHGLTDYTKIRNVQTIIRIDSGAGTDQLFPLTNGYIDCVTDGGYTYEIDATNINLGRVAAGTFDSVNFNATSYNRGWVMIWYEE